MHPAQIILSPYNHYPLRQPRARGAVPVAGGGAAVRVGVGGGAKIRDLYDVKPVRYLALGRTSRMVSF